MDPAKIQLTDLRQLSDGRSLYHFRIDDDRNLHSVYWEFGEDGDVWLLPKRFLYTEKRDPVLDLLEVTRYARKDGVDEIARIWYGQGEDRVLLWEEGMEGPAASAQDEARWSFDQESAEYLSARQS